MNADTWRRRDRSKREKKKQNNMQTVFRKHPIVIVVDNMSVGSQITGNLFVSYYQAAFTDSNWRIRLILIWRARSHSLSVHVFWWCFATGGISSTKEISPDTNQPISETNTFKMIRKTTLVCLMSFHSSEDAVSFACAFIWLSWDQHAKRCRYSSNTMLCSLN